MLTVSSTRVKSDTKWINDTWDGSHEMMEGMLTSTHEAPDKQSYMVFDGTKSQRHRIHQRLQSKFRHISYPVKGTEESQSLEKIAETPRMMIISVKDLQSTNIQGDIVLTDMKGIEIVSQSPVRVVDVDITIKTSEPPTKRRKNTETDTRETEPYYYKTITGENVWKPVDKKITTNNPQGDIVYKKVRHGNDSTCVCS